MTPVTRVWVWAWEGPAGYDPALVTHVPILGLFSEMSLSKNCPFRWVQGALWWFRVAQDVKVQGPCQQRHQIVHRMKQLTRQRNWDMKLGDWKIWGWAGADLMAVLMSA